MLQEIMNRSFRATLIILVEKETKARNISSQHFHCERTVKNGKWKQGNLVSWTSFRGVSDVEFPLPGLGERAHADTPRRTAAVMSRTV